MVVSAEEGAGCFEAKFFKASIYSSLNRDHHADMALPALLDQVHSHLLEVRIDPSKPLNQKLLEHVDSQVTGMWRLFARP